jgi:hypothetical protein
MRHLLDLLERGARVLGEQRTADDVRSAALHRDNRLVGIGLDRADQHLYLARRARRALRELLHLVGDDREPAASLARTRRLDGRVQSENVGLLRDLLDQLDDVADFLRAFAEALDALGGVLNGLAYRVHAVDRAAHGFAALVRDVDGMTSDVGTALRVAGYFLDRLHHLRDGLRSGRNLFRLRLARADQVPRGRVALLRRGVDENRRFVDRCDELAQGLDRIIDRVGDRSGDVLGHGRLHRQVAVGKAGELVEQPQNGLLITLVLLGVRFGRAPDVPRAVVSEGHQREQQ